MSLKLRHSIQSHIQETSYIYTSYNDALDFPLKTNDSVLEPDVILRLVIADLCLSVLPENTFSLLAIRDWILINKVALFTGATSVLRSKEYTGLLSAFAQKVEIIRCASVTGVADGVGGGAATTCLVQSWSAARTDPTGLGTMMRRVGTRLTLGAHGVPTSAATFHHTPAGAASRAVRIAAMVAQVGSGFDILKKRTSKKNV